MYFIHSPFVPPPAKGVDVRFTFFALIRGQFLISVHLRKSAANYFQSLFVAIGIPRYDHPNTRKARVPGTPALRD
jgi:hypothetical protein